MITIYSDIDEQIAPPSFDCCKKKREKSDALKSPMKKLRMLAIIILTLNQGSLVFLHHDPTS